MFKLRRGVTFHNGKEMTAADVVYSLHHHLGEKSQSGAKGYLEVVKSVRASDTYEVTFELHGPYADLPYVLSDYHLLIVPEGSDFRSPIGTGPYVIRVFEPGVRTLAERNPNYWKEGRGWADSVETLALNDLTARTSALQTGAVHFVNRLDPKTVHLLARASNVAILDVPSAGHYTFVMRCDTPPFDNNDLRLALKWGIDRHDLVDKILRGYGRVGNDHPIPEFDPFFHASMPPCRNDNTIPSVPPSTSRNPAIAARLRSTSPMPPSPARSMLPSSTRSIWRRPGSRSTSCACPMTAIGRTSG